MASAGYDSITIDMQHGMIDYNDMVGIVRALSASGAVPVVRIRETNAAEIGRVLDAGVHAIICPLVNTKEQAEQLVLAAKYPPTGIRSFGPVRASRGVGAEAYFESANNEVMLLPMIETAQAMANLDEILSVPGIDGAYIGPADLSIGLGLGLPTTAPSKGLSDAISTVLAACIRHGKLPAVHQVPGFSPNEFRRQGFRFLTSGIDVHLTFAGASSAVRAAQPA
jgi:4-hydroxy-2-oxoheptanedioate aldolase